MNIDNMWYFDAAIWGTVSDWVMTIATILTVVYLILTFEKQKALYIIEKEKFRNSKKPIFNVEIGKAPYKTSTDFFIKLINTQNVARQVMFQSEEYYEQYSFQKSNISTGRKHEIEEGTKIGFAKVIGDLIPNDHFTVEINVSKFVMAEFIVLFSLTFYDETAETRYIQYFGINFTNGKVSKEIPKIFKQGMKTTQGISNL